MSTKTITLTERQKADYLREKLYNEYWEDLEAEYQEQQLL